VRSGSELVTIGVSISMWRYPPLKVGVQLIPAAICRTDNKASVSSTASGVKQGKTESPVTLFASVVAASRVTRGRSFKLGC